MMGEVIAAVNALVFTNVCMNMWDFSGFSGLWILILQWMENEYYKKLNGKIYENKHKK